MTEETKANKKFTNACVSAETRQLLNELAKVERRTMSTIIALAVEERYARTFPSAVGGAKQAA